MDTSKRYIYVKVIEAVGVAVDSLFSEPFVEVKYNGSEVLHKKSTKYQAGQQWWEKIFRFTVKDPDTDWFAVEVRDKSLHLIGSDWIGEVQLQVKTFKDGAVHDNWYALTKCDLKDSHGRDTPARIHLAVQVLNNQVDRPFAELDQKKKMTYDEWVEQGMVSPGMRKWQPTTTHMEQRDPTKLYSHFELTYPTIEEAAHNVAKHAHRILNGEHYSTEDIAEMKKLNRVNCLHRGRFEDCKGKIYMVAIDGSESAKAAFQSTLRTLDPERDHLFFVTVRERVIAPGDYSDRASVILRHSIWKAAAGIICQYQDMVQRFDPRIDYTSVLPESDDARDILCALVRRYHVDVLVIAKHKSGEMRHKSRYFRSFSRYCQGHAKCSVMTFGQGETQSL
eukprot:TRINITY_DN11653_c0_g1_i2.p1 TRINITY_DN11653_c0_g1~~TRINITY_DN11653_c0_g1_i2.p1  ORF type:complete len:392 (+),score=93.13 TRINITY_DN11653_c0_g1_i2:123-1298(+)